MRLNFRFQKYDSKLATIVSLFQSGIAGWIFLFPICCIPAFICLACNVSGAIVGALFGVGGVLSIIVKPEKIDERARKRKQVKRSNDTDTSPFKDYQSEEEHRRNILMRSYVGSQIASEKRSEQENTNNLN